MHTVIENFAKDIIKLMRFVIENKPIKRISRRRVKGKYVDKAFQSPVNASGNLAKTLRYEITDTRLSIYANDYIYDLIYGKPPLKSMSGLDLKLESQIKSWMSFKGISTVGVDDNTLAQQITNKIQKFGSSIYLAYHGQNSGLLDNIVNDKLIQDYNAKFTEVLGNEFKEAFLNG